jgi:hypothetical protein
MEEILAVIKKFPSYCQRLSEDATKLTLQTCLFIRIQIARDVSSSEILDDLNLFFIIISFFSFLPVIDN